MPIKIPYILAPFLEYLQLCLTNFNILLVISKLFRLKLKFTILKNFQLKLDFDRFREAK